MWSTLGLELLRAKNVVLTDERMFQCPHGLELLPIGVKNDLNTDRVSMPSRAWVVTLKSRIIYREKTFQCPLGLIPHFYSGETRRCWESKKVSMPSRAYTSFLHGLTYYNCNVKKIDVSMPSRAYTSFLRYPFKKLGFMRFPEPVFAGIYQNILTTAVFRAC